MNSCLAILLVLGANPYQQAAPARTAAGIQQRQFVAQQPLRLRQPLTIQRPQVIFTPDVRQLGSIGAVGTLQQPVVIYQTQPQLVAQPIQLIQATVPPMPYDQPVPATNVTNSYPQPLTASQMGMPATVNNGSCGGSCGSSCGNSCGSCCGCSSDEFGSCLGKVFDLFGNKCECGCECEDDDKFDKWESTYDMPQHIPYQPAYHGYYYYRPYNYRHVLEAKQVLLGESSIAPYTSMVFEQVYAEFPRASFNPDPADELEDDPYVEPAPEKLPSLTDLLDG